MHSVAVRMILYVLSPALVTLAGLLAGWGVAYDEAAGILSLHLQTVVTAIVLAGLMSGGVLARWGVTRGQSLQAVAVRVILYVLSSILVAWAALLGGWGITYSEAAGVLLIHVETVVTAIVTALGLSGAVFAKWGVK